MLARLQAVPGSRLHLQLMLVLTFTTGIVDAVGYLGLDRVFTGNMTGNVVILGMALAGGDDLPIVGPLVALAGFMTGAAGAGRCVRGVAPGWTPRISALFGAVTAVVLVAAAVLVVDGPEASVVAIVVTAALGVAMGAQAATARFLAVKDVTTVVITSTITGMAADVGLASGWRAGLGGLAGRRAVAILLMLAGAVAGAALTHWHPAAGLFLAAVVIGGTTVLGELHARR